MADLSTIADQPTEPEQPALPTGPITFLFSDIEGSTRLLLRQGEGYAAVLADHQRLLRAAWTAHGGIEIDTQGDSFFVVFSRATEALAAAAQAQRALAAHPWPAGAPVRVRMGLHSGIGTLHDGHYVGLDVHRAARIAAAGHGGQVLLSAATRDQVARELVAGAGLRDLGKHRLKDLPRREEIYQLVLSDLPNDHPPLKTLDAWPGLRADLVAVVLVATLLLALVGLLLPFAIPEFPRAIGLVAAGLAGLLLLASAVARPVRRALVDQWRDARKSFAAFTSALLALVVVVTTLFVTRPEMFLKPAQQGYDWSYTYHAPTSAQRGGSMVIESGLDIHSLIPPALNGGSLPDEVWHAVWNTCLVELPDLRLPYLEGWKADQCTEVPTIANGGESADYKTTTFRIDPHAVWSDGFPLTADDFLFAFRLMKDPNVEGSMSPCQCPSIDPPWSKMTLRALDTYTVRIEWSEPYGDFLAALAQLSPLPLHVYASGPYAGVYNPRTDAYNSALARRLAMSGNFNLWIPVDNGPFVVRGVDGYPLPYQADVITTAQRLVLARNPHFFSNYFHTPVALDQVTFVTRSWDVPDQAANDKMIAAFRQGGVTVVDTLGPPDLVHLGGIPQGEVIINPIPHIVTMGFNQRGEALNARDNGGASIFRDPNVRRAFIEAFDRCGALKAALGLRDCADYNIHTNQHAAPPSPDYDASVTLPAYNPADADRLLTSAGFPVEDGIRRYKDGKTPLRLTISTSGGAVPYQGLARWLAQDYLRNLHVAVHFELPLGELLGGTGAAGTFDIGMWREDVGPDPLQNLVGWGWDSASIPSARNPDGNNTFGMIDPWIVAKGQLALTIQDEGERAGLYKQIARHVSEQSYFLPLLVAADVTLVKPTLCNFKKWPELGFYLWNIADWYVAPSCP